MAKASLQELLLDYEDYLRTRDKEMWPVDSEKAIQTRKVCSLHNESSYYREAIRLRNDKTICNIAITLIHQADLLLLKLIERAKADFLRAGGIKEQMYNARIQHRNHPNKQD